MPLKGEISHSSALLKIKNVASLTHCLLLRFLDLFENFSRLPEREHILETACEEPTKVNMFRNYILNKFLVFTKLAFYQVCCQTPSRFIDEQDPETPENPTSEKKFEPIQDKYNIKTNA